MKTKLTPAEKSDLLPKVMAVLETGEPWEDKGIHHPAGAIIDALLTIKGMARKETQDGNGEGFTTNGWQYDWWQHFSYLGRGYTLSGSGYYGGHSFKLSDGE